MWWMQEVTTSTGRKLAELKEMALDRIFYRLIMHETMSGLS